MQDSSYNSSPPDNFYDNVFCIICNMIIKTPRFKCSNCSDDVSLCSDCFDKKEQIKTNIESDNHYKNSSEYTKFQMYGHDDFSHIFIVIQHELPHALYPSAYQIPVLSIYTNDPRRGDLFDTICDGCNTVIKKTEIRYKCANCFDFDYCIKCFSEHSENHSLSHVFYILTREIPPPTLRPNMLITNLYATHTQYWKPNPNPNNIEIEPLELNNESSKSIPIQNDSLSLVLMPSIPNELETNVEFNLDNLLWDDMSEITEIERDCFDITSWGKETITRRLINSNIPTFCTVMRVSGSFCRGYLLMADKWFDEFMYQIVIDKTLLPQEIVNVLKQDPIILPPWDPMGALAN